MTEVYLYQTIHLLDRKPLFLVEHTTLLNSYSQQLFGRSYNPDIRQLAAEITALATSELYPCDLSGFVRLTLDSSGATSLTPVGTSLYRGYTLRSITPEAVTLQYDLPLSEGPTSTREAAASLARQQAEQAGARIAVRCNGAGIVLTADDAPLFAIRGTTLYASPAAESVERNVVILALRKAGIDLREDPIERRQLPYFDELFYFDHRGFTSLSRCDEQPYMTVLIERVATALGQFLKA